MEAVWYLTWQLLRDTSFADLARLEDCPARCLFTCFENDWAFDLDHKTQRIQMCQNINKYMRLPPRASISVLQNSMSEHNPIMSTPSTAHAFSWDRHMNMSFAPRRQHKRQRLCRVCFPSHSKLKPGNPSLAHRYILRDGTHKGKSHLQKADNKADAGKQRRPQPGKETAA